MTRRVAQYSTYKLINRAVEKGGDVDRLSEVFSALADPTRRAILARLAEGEATVNQLAEPFPISLQAVSKHLKVLERAGLITRGKEAQWRPCRLDAGPLREVADWIASYERFWELRYDRLGEYLQQLQSDKPDSRRSETDE
jgi:DNA-binding transcriptional ArsR family regulator